MMHLPESVSIFMLVLAAVICSYYLKVIHSISMKFGNHLVSWFREPITEAKKKS